VEVDLEDGIVVRMLVLMHEGVGVVSPDNARRALAELRRRHKEIAAHLQSIKTAYDGAMKTIEDPAARVAELTSRFGSLQK
jgi:hypothetical protein